MQDVCRWCLRYLVALSRHCFLTDKVLLKALDTLLHTAREFCASLEASLFTRYGGDGAHEAPAKAKLERSQQRLVLVFVLPRGVAFACVGLQRRPLVVI